MTKRDVLALAKPAKAKIIGIPKPQPETISKPDFGTQIGRLTPQFHLLSAAFEESLMIQHSPDGAAPEQVVVFETIGSVDEFITATRYVPGLELLGEWTEADLPADDDFYKINKDGEKIPGTVSGRLYLIMTNQSAMRQLLSLWQQYSANKNFSFPRGTAKIREVFERLKTVRLWGPQDRLVEQGGIDVWTQELVTDSTNQITVQIELWFSNQSAVRNKSSNHVRGLVSECGGITKQEFVLPEIGYHGLLATLPPAVIKELVEKKPIRFINYDKIMYVRGCAQYIVPPVVEFPADSAEEGSEPTSLLPTIALLDGVPLENHKLLANWLVVDDPEDFASKAAATDRRHGTAMASLLVHGDLNKGTPALKRKVYVQPVLLPNASSSSEQMPEDRLPVELIYNAVKRICDTTSGVMPSVRIVNLSVCDLGRPFDQFPSPMARLLDYLAYEYKILFVVSAGNCSKSFKPLLALTEDKRTEEALLQIASDLRNRRILSPAESVNGVTIGALHMDGAPRKQLGVLVDPLPREVIPSPINTVGHGFGRSIKPDLLMPGGRQLYRTAFDGSLWPADSERFGLQVALPSKNPGQLNMTGGVCGTSGAAALASRRAGLLLDGIFDLVKQNEFKEITESSYAVLTKALLVHGSTWGESATSYDVLKSRANSRTFRHYLSRFFGYGYHSSEDLLASSDNKVTMLGWGSVGVDEKDTFTLPLPICLSGKKIWKRLSITLAWLTPVNPNHQAYRKVSLKFSPPHSKLQLNRKCADSNAVQRGSVQHEVLEGSKAVAFQSGDTLALDISCSSPTDSIVEKCNYGLAVTLEVEEGLHLPVWQQVKDVLIDLRTKVAAI